MAFGHGGPLVKEVARPKPLHIHFHFQLFWRLAGTVCLALMVLEYGERQTPEALANTSTVNFMTEFFTRPKTSKPTSVCNPPWKKVMISL